MVAGFCPGWDITKYRVKINVGREEVVLSPQFLVLSVGNVGAARVKRVGGRQLKVLSGECRALGGSSCQDKPFFEICLGEKHRKPYNIFPQAGIAQLVEHNLAKVGVASSSLVSRSHTMQASSFGGFFYFVVWRWRGARVVEWGGLENRCALIRTEGSNPSLSA